MTFESLRYRLRSGRPLVVDADTCAAFRARGVDVDTPGAVGLLLRRQPEDVLAHYRAEVASRVDVLCALTADTTPRALAEVGMQHRAALLTGRAVELALEVASEALKPVAVAGVIGSDMVAPMAADRLHEEFGEHAWRLRHAGCELIIARGQGSRLGLMAAVAAAAETELPTWAVIECLPNGDLASGGPLWPLLEALEEAGASVVLFEVSAALHARERLAQFSATGIVPGVLLAGSPESVRGFPDTQVRPEEWAGSAVELEATGARVIGGGAGTTETHTAFLARALGVIHPSLPVVRAGSAG